MSARMVLISFLSLLTNLFGCAFAYATAHKMLPWIIGLGFLLPIINFSISLLFLEAKTLREKLYIMLISSVALSVGGATVSLYFG